MCKKALFVTLIWIVFVVIVLLIYLLREISPLKEIIAWALSIWLILAALFAGAIFISRWVIKRDFTPKSRQIVANDATKQRTALGDFLLEGEEILKGIDEQKAEEAIALADDWINRTHDYLKKELPSHASIFLSNSGLERVTHLKPKIKNRLTRIRQIMGYPDS